MPTKYIHTSIDGRALKLSNLEKVLYPSIGITKAQVIQYYLDVAPSLLRYIKDRPLTVIRFPDGVEGKSFYSKDKPAWTPEWIPGLKIQHEEKTIDYLIPIDKPSIVWLANLACLELHPTQFIRHNDMKPDFFVVDLDPDEQLGFGQVKEAAWQIRDFLIQYDYTAFLKTSGGKGLHLYIPIIPETTFDEMIDALKSIVKIFIAQHQKLYTLNVSKAQRKGKILIDIYRNYLSNTTVAPFSLRGKKGAPVSLPILWEHLDNLEKSSQYNITNYKSYLEANGDVWESWRDHETSLHNRRQIHSVDAPLDDRLKDYVDKRDFKKTAEPQAQVSSNYKDQYVIQLHNASNLHYDLRLEDKGVLLSWAIPKGLPFVSGQKRLAIRTEDHPIKYINFEGVIPKGAYGAGEMWVLHGGKIIWKKKSDSSYHFTLKSPKGQRGYKLFKTGKGDQWLVECESDYTFVNDSNRVAPMLASASRTIPKSSKYAFEVKWDGIRVIVYYENDKVKIISRGGRDITEQFPELQMPDICRVEHAVLDAEIVVLDDKGRPMFHDVISRMHKKGISSIKRLMTAKPVTCYVFDLLSLDGYDVMHEPLKRRRAWLKTILKSGVQYRMSETFNDGAQLFKAIELQGMEGVMAKDQTGRYLQDHRSDSWIKIKCRKLEQCTIIGYTEGQGDRAGLMGAMHLVVWEDDRMVYKGKVGTGYDHAKLKMLYELLSSMEVVDKPIDDKIEEEHKTTWIKPELSCEIEYATLSSNGTYREPVFIKLNEEL